LQTQHTVNGTFLHKVVNSEGLKRPSMAIHCLHHLIHRYLSATLPEDARIATGSNTPIIVYLSRHRTGDVFQHDIERHFSITRSTASRVLTRMEAKGLIKREEVAQDKRLRKISLTDKSWGIVEQLRENASHMEETLLEGLSETQIKQLLQALATMRKNLISTGLVGTHRDQHSREKPQLGAVGEKNDSTTHELQPEAGI
ncbi:MAG: MarR family winged helix-turn-helix transcriptional regulator, partial [Bifidobacterium aquikefiri]|uniref:MarR family winged helix-turn-helix transcriptional regulator n=1 Tax=Bifidobacterium aquikefiri TaxID=1653207 RepID=UPI0039E846DE